MSIYPWNMKLTVQGYDFLFLNHEGDAFGVLVPPDTDMDDEDYVEALAKALSLYEFINIFNDLTEARDAWYTRRHYGNDFEQFFDRAKVLHKAHKFLQQDELTKPDWIIKFADDLASNTRPPKPEPEPKPKKKAEKPGFVYLLKSDKGHYKIGRTVNPESRSKTFGIQLPFDVTFECLIETQNMFALEAELHARFADKRTTGEWFDLTPEDVEYIKGLAK